MEQQLKAVTSDMKPLLQTVTPLPRIKEVLLSINKNVVNEVRLTHDGGVFSFRVGFMVYRYLALDLDVRCYMDNINELIKMLNEVHTVHGNLIRFNYINTELSPRRFSNTTIVNGNTIELIEDTFGKERIKDIGFIRRIVNKFRSL